MLTVIRPDISDADYAKFERLFLGKGNPNDPPSYEELGLAVDVSSDLISDLIDERDEWRNSYGDCRILLSETREQLHEATVANKTIVRVGKEALVDVAIWRTKACKRLWWLRMVFAFAGMGWIVAVVGYFARSR